MSLSIGGITVEKVLVGSEEALQVYVNSVSAANLAHCVHTGNPATCTQAQICSRANCGHVIQNALDHNPASGWTQYNAAQHATHCYTCGGHFNHANHQWNRIADHTGSCTARTQVRSCLLCPYSTGIAYRNDDCVRESYSVSECNGPPMTLYRCQYCKKSM